MRSILVLLLLAGCNDPVEEVQAQPMPEPVVQETQPVAAPAVVPEPQPEPPKPKPLTYDRCQRINERFIQCGFRCARGRGVGYCVNYCAPLLSKQGKKCLQKWGPCFG